MNNYSLGGKKYIVNFDNGELNALIEAFYRLHPGLHKHIKQGTNYVEIVENKHLAEMLLENVLEYNKNGFYGDLSEVKDPEEREKIFLLANVYNTFDYPLFLDDNMKGFIKESDLEKEAWGLMEISNVFGVSSLNALNTFLNMYIVKNNLRVRLGYFRFNDLLNKYFGKGRDPGPYEVDLIKKIINTHTRRVSSPDKERWFLPTFFKLNAATEEVSKSFGKILKLNPYYYSK